METGLEETKLIRPGFREPEQGFGRLWRRTYRIRLPGINLTPRQLVETWRERFADFWTEGSYVADLRSVRAPGETAEIHLKGPLGVMFVTGFLVLTVDETQFELMTANDHIFSGIITFDATLEDGVVVARTSALVRPSDPLWELMFRAGLLSTEEDKFWIGTLNEMARQIGVAGEIEVVAECLDSHVKWENLGNARHNLGIKTALRMLAAPFKRLKQGVQAQSKTPAGRRRLVSGLALAAAVLLSAAGVFLFLKKRD